MAVYVDPLFRMESRNAQAFRVGQRHDHRWCHLYGDTEEELHELADRIGMKREWHQSCPPHRLSHYDLTPPKRRLAIRFGTIEVSAGHKPGDPLPKGAGGLFGTLAENAAPEEPPATEYGW